MGQLFGTDGIRGRANTYPMTCELGLKAGQAVGIMAKEDNNQVVVIGRDTRISGQMLESALAAGIASIGVDVLLAGVIPTPGVAFLSGEEQGPGIVISASHNPYYDNGIKIFQKGGIKLSDAQEEKIEAYILGDNNVPRKDVGKISMISGGCETYAVFLLGKFPARKPLKRLKLIIDTSNGAAYETAPLVFNKELFDVQFIHCQPNGVNINDNCGSQHTSDLRDLVLSSKADVGLAFDGDADRLIAVDETGQIITGDRILAICAKYAKETNTLDNNIVVSTTMSNIGLGKALEALEIEHCVSDVGDRKVLEKMKQTGAIMGGEDSGHMIFLQDHTTGDGILTALKLLEVILGTGQSLSTLAGVMTVYPQILINVEVDASRPDFTKIPAIAHTIKEVEALLGDQGRVLVRYSGTQPLLRVMVEGPDENQTKELCERICTAIQENI